MNDKSKNQIDRRTFVKSMGAVSVAIATGLATKTARAAGSDPKKKDAGHVHALALKKVVDTTSDCIKTGELCLAHCMQMLSQGDTTMKDCAQTVSNMLAVCAATLKVAAMNTAKPSELKGLLIVCSSTCKTCLDACREHAAQMEVCKTCADSCKSCADACDQALKA